MARLDIILPAWELRKPVLATRPKVYLQATKKLCVVDKLIDPLSI